MTDSEHKLCDCGPGLCPACGKELPVAARDTDSVSRLEYVILRKDLHEALHLLGRARMDAGDAEGWDRMHALYVRYPPKGDS